MKKRNNTYSLAIKTGENINTKYSKAADIGTENLSEFTSGIMHSKTLSGMMDYQRGKTITYMPKKQYINPVSNDVKTVLRSFAEYRDMTGKKSSTKLMHSVVQDSIKFMPNKTLFGSDVYQLNQSAKAFMESTDAYVFDIETLSGKNAAGVQKYDFITEVSFQHYDYSSVPLKKTWKTPTDKSFNAIIGLSKQDANDSRAILRDVLNGDKSHVNIDSLTEQQRVHLGEVIKYSDMSVGEHTVKDALGFRVFAEGKTKMSTDELNVILKRGDTAELARRYEQGLDFLTGVYDKKAADNIQQRINDVFDVVNAQDSKTMLVSANGRHFDLPFLRAKYGVSVDPSREFDITAAYRYYIGNVQDGQIEKGQATVSKMFEAFGYTQDGVAHAADWDTKMTAAILGSDGFADTLKAISGMQESDFTEFKVGSTYIPNKSTPIFGYYQNRELRRQYGSGGLNIVNGNEIDMNYAYDPTLMPGVPYSVNMIEDINLKDAPDDLKNALVRAKGDGYKNIGSVRRVVMTPTVDNAGKGFRGDSVVMIATDDELVDMLSVFSSADGIGSKDMIKAGEKAIDAQQALIRDAANRSFYDNPYKYYQQLKSSGKSATKELAEAITKRDTSAISRIGQTITDGMVGRKTSNPEFVSHFDSLFTNLTEWSSVFDTIDSQLVGVSGAERRETFNYVFRDILDNFEAFSQDGSKYYGESASRARRAYANSGKRQLTVNLPSVYNKNSRTKSATIALDNKYGATNLQRLIARISGKNFDSMSATDAALEKITLAEKFIGDVIVDNDASAKVRNTLFQNRFLEQGDYINNGKFGAYRNRIMRASSDNEIASIVDDLFSSIYTSLSDSDVGINAPGSSTKDIDKIEALTRGSAYLKHKGKDNVVINTIDDLKEYARKLTASTPIQVKPSTPSAMPLFNGLIDKRLLSVEEYTKHLTGMGISQKQAQSMATLNGKHVDSYISWLRGMVSEYTKNGIGIEVSETGEIFGFDSVSKKIKLNLPQMKIAANGSAYMQIGNKVVNFESKMVFKNGKLEITNPFTEYIKYNQAGRYIENTLNAGNDVTIDTLTRHISKLSGSVGDLSDAYGHNTSHFLKSNGSIDLTDIGVRLFDQIDRDGNVISKGLESSGFLTGLDKAFISEYGEEKGIQIYNTMKEAYQRGAKYKTLKGLSIPNLDMQYSEIFNSNISLILKTIASNTDNSTVANILGMISPSYTQEGQWKDGTFMIGDTPYVRGLSGYEKKRRPTGYQTGKARAMDVDKLAELGFDKPYNMVETTTTARLNYKQNVLNLADAANGLNETNVVQANIGRISQKDFKAAVDAYLNDQSNIEAIKKEYGEDAANVIKAQAALINLSNDGSLAFGDVSRALTGSVNNDVRKNAKQYRLTGYDCIPEFTINPKNGAVEIKYSDAVYIKQGESLKFFNKTTDLIEEKKASRGLVGRMVMVTDDYITLDEKKVNSLLKEIKFSEIDLNDIKIGKTQDKIDIVNKYLKDKGVSLGYVFENAVIHTKIGMTEEKTFATSVLLAIDTLDSSKNILKKYGFYNSEYADMSGTVLTDEAYDMLRKKLKISDEDFARLNKDRYALEKVARGALGVKDGQRLDMLTNLTTTKHQALVQSIDHQISALQDVLPENEFKQLVDEVFDGYGTVENGRIIFKNGDPDSINTSYLTEQYEKHLGEYTGVGSTTLDGKMLITQGAVQPMIDWEGGKFSGDINQQKANLISEYRSLGDSAEDSARKKQISLELANIDREADGVTLKRRDIDTLQRQRVSPYRIGDNVINPDTDNIAAVRTHDSLVRRGIVGAESGGKYTLTEEALNNKDSLLAKTIASLEEEGYKGTNGLDLTLNDYFVGGQLDESGAFSTLSDEQKAIIRKNRENLSKYGDYTVDKLQVQDTYENYRRNIAPVNKRYISPTDQSNAVARAKENGIQVLNARDLDIGSYDANDHFVIKRSGNPYTNDTIIDLGERFAHEQGGRYVAVKGMPARYMDDETSVLYNYQKKLRGIQETAQDLYDLQNGTLSQARASQLWKYSGGVVNDNSTIQEKEQYLVNRLGETRDQLVALQNEAFQGKDSVATMIGQSKVQGMSAMLETQTLDINSDILRGKKFRGTDIQELYTKYNSMPDYVVIGNDSARKMGFYDEDYMRSAIEDFKKLSIDDYDDVIKKVGKDASDEVIMHEILSTHGTSVIGGRYPTIRDRSVSAVQVYISDDIKDNTARISRITQYGWGNDNDSDKIFLANPFKKDSDELLDSIAAQMGKNYDTYIANGGFEKVADNFDIDAINKNREMFGRTYKNIVSQKDYIKAGDTLNNSKYFDDFVSLYDSTYMGADNSLLSISEHSKAFEEGLVDYASSHGITDDGFADEMKRMFVAKERIADYNAANVTLASKSKVGSANNQISRLMDFASGFSVERMRKDGFGQEADMAENLINYIRGDAIENVINAKNRATEESASLTSRFNKDINTILYGGSKQERLSVVDDIADILGGEKGIVSDKINEFIEVNKIGNFEGEALVVKRKEMLTNAFSGIAEADTRGIKDLINRFEYGISGRGAFIDPYESTPTGFDRSMDLEALLTNQQRTTSANAAQDMAQSIYDGASVGSTASQRRTVGQMSSELLSSLSSGNINLSKGLAMGALGLAATIMVTGFIGGNPSQAPQENAMSQAAGDYTQDNYNYDTGTVMMPQQASMPNHGYVVNMKAKTKGSYAQANAQMIQAAQQSYMPNMNISVRQKFSYSTAQPNNDRYVEGILSKLINM